MEFTQPLSNFVNNIIGFLPDIIGAIIILIVGWIIAKIIKALIIKLLKSTSWDEKLFKQGMNGKDTNEAIGNIFYYLIMVIVFLIALDGLGLSNVLAPLEAMVAQFLLFIPNLIAAIIIASVGYILAKFVSNLVGLAGEFIGNWVQKLGLKDPEKIINVLKTVVFIIIFVPLLIQAINALQLESLSDPLNAILSGFIAIIGDVIVAAVILFIFIWVGNLLRGFLADLLKNLGVDGMAEKIQLHHIIGPNQSFSKLAAGILYFFIVFFGVVAALDILHLERLTAIMYQILSVVGSIAFGLVILLIGNFISILIYNAMTQSDSNKFIASVVRYATLGLFIGISLRAMGIANEIVELAFGLTLGAVAVVIALSYGLGGREAAGEHFREIIQNFKGNNSSRDSSGPTINR